MEAYFKALTLWLASGSEAAAALVIGLATIEATLRALWLFVKGAFPRIGIREHQDEGAGAAATRPLARRRARIRAGRRRIAHRRCPDLGRDRPARRDRRAAHAAELFPAKRDR